MYKPSIQSIVLPSIYENKPGENKEDSQPALSGSKGRSSRQDVQNAKGNQRSSGLMQRSTSHFAAISTTSPQPFDLKDAKKRREDHRRKVISTTRPAFHVKNGKLLIVGK
jgi:hypothetical protein